MKFKAQISRRLHDLQNCFTSPYAHILQFPIPEEALWNKLVISRGALSGIMQQKTANGEHKRD